ncbi:MAG: GntR family transcriptional regulator [Clostridiaceae bacterium]
MEFCISIDRNSSMGVYRQIAGQIREAIENGTLKPGERLPTERELCVSLNLARGTVNKAYEELKRDNVIEVIQGSGSFVRKEKKITETYRKELAGGYIEEFLTSLETLNFTPGEIQALVDLAISERANPQKKVNIATIDCNEESLAVFKEQFSSFANITVRMFLLDDMLKYSNPEKVFEDYDIIITTITHYEQVAGMIHSLKDRICKAAVSPTQDTVISIATVPKSFKIGMIVKSNNFKNLMYTRLESMNIDISKVESAFEDDLRKVDKLLLECDVLIIPHFLLLNNQKLEKQLHYFRGRGGNIIDFRYQIERGSLIYIEERAHKLLSESI